MKTPDKNNLNPDLNPEHALKDSKHHQEIELEEHPILDLKNERKEEIDNIEGDIRNTPEKEQYEQKEIKTVAEFLEVLENEIMESDDEKEKKELAFHLIKIKGALRQAGLKAKKLSLMSLNNEEMIDYDRFKKKIKVRRDILDDFSRNQQFFATIFSEIKLEKDKDIRDTGFQLLTIKKKMNINKEVSKKERQATIRTFDNLGIDTALKLYDFANPEELANYFLEKEVKKRLEERGKINKAKSILIAVYLSRLFKKGAPELYKKLKEKKYAWRAKVWELVQENK